MSFAALEREATKVIGLGGRIGICHSIGGRSFPGRLRGETREKPTAG